MNMGNTSINEYLRFKANSYNHTYKEYLLQFGSFEEVQAYNTNLRVLTEIVCLMSKEV